MITLEAGLARAVVSPTDGGRVAALVVGGDHLLVGRGQGIGGGTTPEALLWGCFPMAPWAGRLRHGVLRWDGEEHRLPLTLAPHAIHGTTWPMPWTDAGHDRTSAVMRVALDPPWPFGGHVVHRVALSPDELRLDLEVHAGDRPMPAACGWHPWFPRDLGRGGPARLEVSPGPMWQRDAEGIPTGHLVTPPPGPWDDCFHGMGSPAVVHWPGARRLEIASDCPEWVVFDQPETCLCVEPQTHAPDALNHDPPVLAPGEALRARCTLRWSEG